MESAVRSFESSWDRSCAGMTTPSNARPSSPLPNSRRCQPTGVATAPFKRGFRIQIIQEGLFAAIVGEAFARRPVAQEPEPA